MYKKIEAYSTACYLKKVPGFLVALVAVDGLHGNRVVLHVVLIHFEVHHLEWETTHDTCSRVIFPFVNIKGLQPLNSI